MEERIEALEEEVARLRALIDLHFIPVDEEIGDDGEATD
jgi:hypothetical protein